MRLEQELRDNLASLAGSLVVPAPRRAPIPGAAPSWRRPTVFAAIGALAALTLVVIPTLLLGSPGSDTPVMPGDSIPSPTTSSPTISDVPFPTTTTDTIGDSDETTIATAQSEGFRYEIRASKQTDVEPPTATLILRAISRGVSTLPPAEIVIGEPSMFFWFPVTGTGGVCRFEVSSTPEADRIMVEVLLSPSLGCSDPFVFEQIDGELVRLDP